LIIVDFMDPLCHIKRLHRMPDYLLLRNRRKVCVAQTRSHGWVYFPLARRAKPHIISSKTGELSVLVEVASICRTEANKSLRVRQVLRERRVHERRRFATGLLGDASAHVLNDDGEQRFVAKIPKASTAENANLPMSFSMWHAGPTPRLNPSLRERASEKAVSRVNLATTIDSRLCTP